jgi:hypothetical protein
MAARPDLARTIASAFSLETLLEDLTPALEEELATLAAGASTITHEGGSA